MSCDAIDHQATRADGAATQRAHNASDDPRICVTSTGWLDVSALGAAVPYPHRHSVAGVAAGAPDVVLGSDGAHDVSVSARATSRCMMASVAMAAMTGR